MDSTRQDAAVSGFSATAASLGIKPQLLYSVKTVAKVLGVKTSTIYDEMDAGRMRYHLPPGRKQGRMVAPEWVDEWIKEGIHGN